VPGDWTVVLVVDCAGEAILVSRNASHPEMHIPARRPVKAFATSKSSMLKAAGPRGSDSEALSTWPRSIILILSCVAAIPGDSTAVIGYASYGGTGVSGGAGELVCMATDFDSWRTSSKGFGDGLEMTFSRRSRKSEAKEFVARSRYTRQMNDECVSGYASIAAGSIIRRTLTTRLDSAPNSSRGSKRRQ
jgi:hypothetical protein